MILATSGHGILSKSLFKCKSRNCRGLASDLSKQRRVEEELEGDSRIIDRVLVPDSMKMP